MSSKTIFYSWQSDLDKKLNNYFIRDCVSGAIKKIASEIKFELSLDKDTQQTNGSPDIVDTIFTKIRTADMFVGDISIVNTNYSGRKTPNPNVLIELGYAVRTLGWERVICVVNTDFCKLEDLPFDIRNNRIMTYSIEKEGIKVAKSSLTGALTKALKNIINDYDNIMERFRKDDYLEHDKNIFEKFDMLSPQWRLFDSLDMLCNSLQINQTHYRLWAKIEDFTKSAQNNFLNPEIQKELEFLAKLVDKVHMLAAQKLFSVKMAGMKYISEYEDQGIKITPEIQFEVDQTHWYKFPDGPRDDNWSSYHKRLDDAQNEFIKQASEVESAYRKFRGIVKKYLLI